MNIVRWARLQWDRVTAWICIFAGGIAIVTGWAAVGREALTAQQIPYIISGGIGGLFLLGVGAVLWLSADLRDEWRKLDEIARQHSAAPPLAVDESDPFVPAQLADQQTTTTASVPPSRRRRPIAAQG